MPPLRGFALKDGRTYVAFNATWWHALLALVFARPRVRRRYLGAKFAIDRVVGVAPAGHGA